MDSEQNDIIFSTDSTNFRIQISYRRLFDQNKAYNKGELMKRKCETSLRIFPTMKVNIIG